MASITKALTQTLVAATATDDTVVGQHSAIEITNHTSGSPLYVSIGATAPTVAGADFFVVLGGDTKRFSKQGGGKTGGTQVRLIAAGTPTVTIAALLA